MRPSRSTYDMWKVGISPTSGMRTTDPEPLVTGLELLNINPTSPSITRDGRRLYYTKGRSYSNLWLLQPSDPPGDQLTTTRLTSGTAMHGRPTVSPDGEYVAYLALLGGTMSLFVMPVEGGPARQMTFVDSVATNPVWSPDGEYLAFGVMRERQIRLATAMVSDPAYMRVLESTDLGANGLLSWAPGSELMYQTPSAQDWTLRDMESGTERSLLSADSARGWVFNPVVSPDGRYVALSWNRRAMLETGMFVISLTDGAQQRVMAGVVTPIGWSPDGRYVYGLVNGERKLYRVPAHGGEPDVLAEFPFEWASGSATPDGNLFVIEEPGRQADVWMIENFDPGRR